MTVSEIESQEIAVVRQQRESRGTPMDCAHDFASGEATVGMR